MEEHFVERDQARSSRKKIRKRHECEICHLTFSTVGNLKRHSLSHSTASAAPPSVRTKGTNLKPAQGSSSGEERFTCSSCGKVFASKQALKAHMGSHGRSDQHILITGQQKEEPRYKCLRCEKSFAYYGNLTRHLNRHLVGCHGQGTDSSSREGGKFVSGAAEQEQQDLRPPVRMMASVYPPGTRMEEAEGAGIRQECQVCGEEFSELQELEAHHMAMTSMEAGTDVVDESSYECQFCGDMFGELRDFETHLTVHEEKEYKCRVCVKEFRFHKNFVAHTNYHLHMSSLLIHRHFESNQKSC